MLQPSHTERGGPGRSKNFPLTATNRRLASFEGEGEPIILANHSPFPCALREGHSRVGGDGVNDHPGWESQILVLSSQKGTVLKWLEEKVASGLKS
ncbi:hypothetical protein AVEN_201237-1 [Araneus ventricosus]|uniref:Uncharacterized protein n=1 Tax=Araneus ventricosus TaxID=182803 RepID=A0A4Y2SMP3_ARAVE|nr:hypothetical protein AVEN_201237-1 [Araneus ventricosus]